MADAVGPNPVRNGVLTIEWFKGANDGIGWSFHDIVGKSIKSGYTQSGNGYHDKLTIDMGAMGLASGVYLLRLTSAKDKWEFKIVYQR